MFKNLKKKKNNKGFTLVELLVVIAIIGILAVVAVPSLFKNLDKAKATQVVTNIKTLQTEVLSEYANSQGYAATVAKVNGNVSKLISDENKKFSEVYTVIQIKEITRDKDNVITDIVETEKNEETKFLGVKVNGGTKPEIFEAVAQQLGTYHKNKANAEAVILPISAE